MRRWVVILFLLSSVSSLWAQDSVGCPYRFSVADRTNFEKGVEAYNAKHYAESAALLRKVSGKNPKAADPYYYLGMIAVKKNDNPGAIRRYFNKLIEVCPDYPKGLAHYYKAVVDYTDEHFEEAVFELNKFFDIANQVHEKEYDAVYEEASNYLYWSQFLAEAYKNQVPFTPELISGVSSRTHEMMPYVTLDGKEIYYIRQVAQNKEQTFYAKQIEQMVPKLYVSRWKNGAFSDGEELSAPFNQHDNEGGVTLTADKKLLYYSMLRNERGYNNCDIYFSEFRDGAWQPIQNAGLSVNGDKTWEAQPTISPDGQYLYFASNRPGGQGGSDIWFCKRQPNGDWGRAENLGPSVNTPGNEKCPFLCADGHTLYFASNGWQGFGGYDMYFINLTDTYMQRPTNLGLPVNSENDDICFGVMADGGKAYFAVKSSQYPGVGGSDVYWFDLYPEARPESMYLRSGIMQSADGAPVKGKISISRYGSDKAEYLVGGDGQFSVMLSSKEDNVLVANAEGFFPQAVFVGRSVRNGMPQTIHLQLVKKDGRYRIIMNPAALDAYVDFLLEHPRMHVRVEAGNSADAKKVYDYFLAHKLRTERLDYKSTSSSTGVSLIITQM